jgi:hypothetical protein
LTTVRKPANLYPRFSGFFIFYRTYFVPERFISVLGTK